MVSSYNEEITHNANKEMPRYVDYHRGRPIKSWIKTVKEDSLDLAITDDFRRGRVAFRVRIRVADRPREWGMSYDDEETDGFCSKLVL